MFARESRPAPARIESPHRVIWPRIPAFLGIASRDRLLERSARTVRLRETNQGEELGGFNFYSDLVIYARDITSLGIKHARTLLYERLFTHLLSMDQEARRKALTYPIPIHFTQGEDQESPLGRVAGYRKEWRRLLLDSLDHKPEGPEKDRFRSEIQLATDAFDALLLPLHELLKQPMENLSDSQIQSRLLAEFGYSRSEITVTPFLIALFPGLAEKFGERIECLLSPSCVYAYPPSRFHLDGRSSFLYQHQIAYLPTKGFVGLQQGLMSAYMEADVQAIIARLVGKNTKEIEAMNLLTSVFAPTGEYQGLPADALFERVKEIIPFEPLAIEAGVNPESCGSEEYENYISALEAIFDREIRMCADDPEYLIGLQERIERFSIYLAVAMGMTKKLPVRQMLTKYTETYRDRQVAQHPREHAEHIDTGFASVWKTLANVSFRLESVFECSAVGALKAGTGRLGAGVSGHLFSLELLAGEIKDRLRTDFANASEAREFAMQYGINPDWIGTVIQHYPGGKECAGYGDQKPHTAHWVGQCGDHTMCLACNAQYNLDHGLVSGMGGGTLQEMQNLPRQAAGDKDARASRSTMGLSTFVAGLGNPKLYSQIFLIETVLKDRSRLLTLPPPELPLAA